VKGREWATLPTKEVASFFSVGGIWTGRPFGYDGALVKHADRQVDILKWCPEYSISLFRTGKKRELELRLGV
jgi:hypothetical protein